MASNELVPVKKDSDKVLRPRSEVATPYFSLDSSLEVPKTIHERAGGACSRDQVAPLLGYNGTKNGGFISRISASKMYGLVDEVGGLLRLTPLATQILSPINSDDEQRGKITAFLNVELFAKVYERFKGQTLPSSQGLENLVRTEYKVIPAQVSKALRVLTESADSAGFFDAGGRGRLVMPLAGNTERPSAPAPPTTPSSNTIMLEPVKLEATGKLGPLPVSSDAKIPPAIYGLIRDLPEEGTTMTTAKRQRLIKAFEASINWLYPDSDEENPS